MDEKTKRYVYEVIRLAEKYRSLKGPPDSEARPLAETSDAPPEAALVFEALRAFVMRHRPDEVQELMAIDFLGREGRRGLNFDRIRNEARELYQHYGDNHIGASEYITSRNALASELRKGLELLDIDQPPEVDLPTAIVTGDVAEAVVGNPNAQKQTGEGDGLGPKITLDAIRAQVEQAQKTGRLGEEAFDYWLKRGGHDAASYTWVSKTHGRAAIDFRVAAPRWEIAPLGLYVDVKTTTGPFETPLYISAAEIRWAANNENYRIARVHELQKEHAKVTILSGVHDVSRSIVSEFLSRLPPQMSADGFWCDVNMFKVVHEGN